MTLLAVRGLRGGPARPVASRTGGQNQLADGQELLGLPDHLHLQMGVAHVGIYERNSIRLEGE